MSSSGETIDLSRVRFIEINPGLYLQSDDTFVVFTVSGCLLRPVDAEYLLTKRDFKFGPSGKAFPMPTPAQEASSQWWEHQREACTFFRFAILNPVFGDLLWSMAARRTFNLPLLSMVQNLAWLLRGVGMLKDVLDQDGAVCVEQYDVTDEGIEWAARVLGRDKRWAAALCDRDFLAATNNTQPKKQRVVPPSPRHPKDIRQILPMEIRQIVSRFTGIIGM